MSGAAEQAHCFILAGGRGTRFWPLSRRARPKQLLDFTGEGSLLALTVARLAPLIPHERQWIITGEDLADAVKEAAPSLPADQILAEPQGRNTAPAVALAAALLEARGIDAPFAVLPSDHLIRPGEDFRRDLAEAFRLAGVGDHLVTFGVSPTRPETGYGYIEAGEALGDDSPARRVRAFREKPDRETAEAYLSSGRHFWNSGMFAWRPSVVLQGLERWQPATVVAVRELAAREERPGTEGFQAAFKRAYEACEAISIDYALLEKADGVVTLPVDFQWNDVGHWVALRDLWGTDSEGNAHRGRLVAVDSRNNVVLGRDRLTALIGVEGMVVVSLGDATLVCPAERAQEIKELLGRLEDEGLTEYL